MTTIEVSFGYKTTINISFDIDNYNEKDILKMIKEDIDETIAKAKAIEDFGCDCYACISGGSKPCDR